MVLLEVWRAKHEQIGKSLRVCNRRAPSWLWACYTTIGVFLFGCACSQLTTDIAKYSVGRLRPHFISVCKPDWSKVLINALVCAEEHVCVYSCVCFLLWAVFQGLFLGLAKYHNLSLQNPSTTAAYRTRR